MQGGNPKAKKTNKKKNSKVLGEGARKVGKLVISVVKMAQQ